MRFYMTNKIFAFLVIGVLVLFIVPPVFAHCPLCTAAAGVAVSVTRIYGIDDLIVGSLIGAFTISTALWLNNYLLKRNKGKKYFSYQTSIITAAVFVSTIASFALFSISSPDYYKLFGIDKLLIGVTAGSIATIAAFGTHNMLRKYNSNKNHLPAQGIILMAIFLVFLNIGFYASGWIF